MSSCYIYLCVKKGTWRRIGTFPFEHGVAYPASGVFLNGVIHWMACEDFTECGGRTSLIAGFYLDHEVFKMEHCPVRKAFCRLVSIIMMKTSKSLRFKVNARSCTR
ncbi:hypothetical protein ACH5RR_033481 [Cinchona calisaya]|uniref:F-box protein n=1 Tax=Cinchona calisaya TaxID=153742 RepID=A0ABD2YN86_9GENT